MMQRPLNISLSEAIMTKIPLVIVEGIDDRQIYTNICKHFSINVKIMRVGEFENFATGCDSVIKCVKELQTNFSNNPDSLRYALGIIDKDSRPYKEPSEFSELNNLQGLFILKYYSIETYFATQNIIKQLVCKITNAIEDDITDDILIFLETKFLENLDNIYYISLDALKEHISGKIVYKAFKNYEQEATATVTETPLTSFCKNKLPNIKNDLDAFAYQYDFKKKDIKNITKGKWFLHYFIYCIVIQAEDLAKIEREFNEYNLRYNQCKSKEDRKLYSFEPVFKIKLLGDIHQKTLSAYESVLNCFDENELQDILDRLRNLG